MTKTPEELTRELAARMKPQTEKLKKAANDAQKEAKEVESDKK